MFVAWRVLDRPGNSAELTAPGGRFQSADWSSRSLRRGRGHHLGWATVGSRNLHKKRVCVITGQVISQVVRWVQVKV